MGSSPPYAVILPLVLAPLTIALLAIPGVRLVRRVAPASSWLRTHGLIIGVAAAHFFLYFGLWTVSFAMADAGEKVPWPLIGMQFILGAPFMYLMYIQPASLGALGRWLGDGTDLIIVLETLNAALWGVAVAWLVARLRHHQLPNNRWRGP